MNAEKETLKKEELRSLLSSQHRNWLQLPVTLVVLRHLDSRIQQLDAFVTEKSLALESVTDIKLRLVLCQLHELKQLRKFMTDDTEFVTKSVK